MVKTFIMERREAIKNALLTTAVGALGQIFPENMYAAETHKPIRTMKDANISPRAVTMWDFSWLERRWPGAGYEDWDKALSELVERGYNAVRIDAFPHLLAEGPDCDCHEQFLRSAICGHVARCGVASTLN